MEGYEGVSVRAIKIAFFVAELESSKPDKFPVQFSSSCFQKAERCASSVT